jgi:cell division protein FtsB
VNRLFSLILLVILGALSFQLYRLYDQRRALSGDLNKTNLELGALSKENSLLEADMEYFKSPENLAKELKSKFDYKRPGEKLMIIVPKR